MRIDFMTTSSRSLITVLLGILVFGFGFWLAFHTADFHIVTTPNGIPFAQYEHVYSFLSKLLMSAGAILGVFSVLLWASNGERPTTMVA